MLFNQRVQRIAAENLRQRLLLQVSNDKFRLDIATPARVDATVKPISQEWSEGDGTDRA